MMFSLLQFLSFSVFAFGTFSFSVLALSYLREPGRGGVLRWFTFACAAAFLTNLAGTLFFIANPYFEFVRDSLAALLPTMMFHLVLSREGRAGAALFWRTLLGVLYVSALLPSPGDEPAWLLAASATAALVLVAVSRRERCTAERRHRIWNVALFGAMLLSASGSLLDESPLFELLPDYLLLAFFGVWLYYSERLAFFDVFLKRGAYLLAGAMLLALVAAMFPGTGGAAFVLLAVWLAGPFFERWIGGWVDRHAFRRRYSPAEAERMFQQAIQSPPNDTELTQAAAGSLTEIFACQAEVSFSAIPPEIEPGDAYARVNSQGWVLLRGRENQMPFLSDDVQLLATLANALGGALQSLHFSQRQRELAELASRAELRALRAQINPHFLFNALNTIAGWIRTRPDLADETVSQLAEVFRYVLNLSQQEWVTLRQELDFVEAYLAVEQARFQDRLSVAMLREPAAEEIPIPAMVIQPLAENAVKHGTTQLVGGGTLRVAVSLLADRVRVTVEDNGPGFPAGFRLDNGLEGHALRNIEARLQGYYGTRSTLRWENTLSGCAVSVEFPREGRTG